MKRVEMKTLVKDTLFELFSDTFKGTSKKMNYTPTEVGGFWEHHRRMIEYLTNR